MSCRLVHISKLYQDPVLFCLAAKNRRQPKPVKPKKFIKMDGKAVSCVAANSGTSAMVTREGQLHMFGKDTTFCDTHSGELGSVISIHCLTHLSC